MICNDVENRHKVQLLVIDARLESRTEFPERCYDKHYCSALLLLTRKYVGCDPRRLLYDIKFISRFRCPSLSPAIVPTLWLTQPFPASPRSHPKFFKIGPIGWPGLAFPQRECQVSPFEKLLGIWGVKVWKYWILYRTSEFDVKQVLGASIVWNQA